MIRFLQHDTIDKLRWDECINCAVNGNLYAFSWYLDIVSPGWCALVDGDYEYVFPLPVSSKAGIKYIIQPYFTQQLGLFCISSPTENKVIEFLNNIPKPYRYIDIYLNASNYIYENNSFIDNTNLELDLNRDYLKISSLYQNNLQRNLKKASTYKLTIAKNTNIEELITLFRANKGQDLKHLNDRNYGLIRQIAIQSIQKGIGEIWGAYSESKQLLAGILWIKTHQQSIFLFSALSETGKRQYAMPWLIDSFIRQNAGKLVTLDFEGSNNEGLARFYSSFGSQRIIYQRYAKNLLPGYLQVSLNLWRFTRSLLKKYQP